MVNPIDITEFWTK